MRNNLQSINRILLRDSFNYVKYFGDCQGIFTSKLKVCMIISVVIVSDI